MWCFSVHSGGMVQPGNVQPLSRPIKAKVWLGEATRRLRYRSSGRPVVSVNSMANSA